MKMTMKNQTAIPEAITSLTLQYIPLKTATAAKLGKDTNAGIGYKISCNPGRTTLYFSITDNSSGGCFSNEYLCTDRIREILQNLDQPAFPSKALKTAFVGKSSNNAGFLAAILHAEGLLARAPVNEAKHVLAGDWNDWKTALLAQAGSSAKADALTAKSTHTQMTAEKPSTLTLKRIQATDHAD